MVKHYLAGLVLVSVVASSFAQMTPVGAWMGLKYSSIPTKFGRKAFGTSTHEPSSR